MDCTVDLGIANQFETVFSQLPKLKKFIIFCLKSTLNSFDFTDKLIM